MPTLWSLLPVVSEPLDVYKRQVFKELATDTVINIVLNSSEIPRFYRSRPARSCFKTSALDAKWSCLDALYWVRVFIPGVWYQNTCREWVFSALNGSRIVVSAKN